MNDDNRNDDNDNDTTPEQSQTLAEALAAPWQELPGGMRFKFLPHEDLSHLGPHQTLTVRHPHGRVEKIYGLWRGLGDGKVVIDRLDDSDDVVSLHTDCHFDLLVEVSNEQGQVLWPMSAIA